MKHIAVISKDLQDFLSWKDEMGLEAGKIVDTRKKFESNDNMYYCVYKPTHLISLTLDTIVETKNAKKGGAYASTMSIAKIHLKADPQLKLNLD